ncbi:MAG: ABC transporter ATP-binding protein [Candidatus Omnitrophica bacterium]|nr:ABC transporter ATP-binding protein [Candidatus Omnitrophota bacterium]
MSVLICFKNLKKNFGSTEVLKGINLDLEQGEIFGLLGPNGAGKTTLLRCLLGLLKIQQGNIYYKDRQLTNKDIRFKFGFLPENFSPPKNLKAVELLNILSWGIVSQYNNTDSLLGLVGLLENKNKYIGAYSRGMIQRLGLACALLKDPQVLILDEPTLGLDPLGQRSMIELLKQLNGQGKTIFFSSHILSQIEKVCARVGIIDKGSLKFTGMVSEIIRKHKVLSLEDAFLKEVEN